MALPKARPKSKKRSQSRSKRARSLAAKKGWERRRRKALVLSARLKTAGSLGIKGYTDPKSGKFVQRVAYDSDRGKDDHRTLREMVNTEDPRWLDFYEFLDEMDFSDSDIYDSWFSPDM